MDPGTSTLQASSHKYCRNSQGSCDLYKQDCTDTSGIQMDCATFASNSSYVQYVTAIHMSHAVSCCLKGLGLPGLEHQLHHCTLPWVGRPKMPTAKLQRWRLKNVDPEMSGLPCWPSSAQGQNAIQAITHVCLQQQRESMKRQIPMRGMQRF